MSGLLLAACSGSSSGSDFGSQNTSDGGTGSGAVDGGSNGGFGGLTGDGSTGTTTACVPSPGNYDIPGNQCDDDGDGQVDNVAACDTGLAATGDAAAFAKAIGLCQTATGASDTKWGVISATFVNGHTGTTPPNDAQHGILPSFGNVLKAREGATLGVLSTGTAAAYDDPSQDDTSTSGDSPAKDIFKGPKIGMQGGGGGGKGGGNSGSAPSGYPKSSQGCGTGKGNVGVNDIAAIRLQIKVPNNAKGLGFDFDFWSGEWPEYVCSDFNDAFIAYLSSQGFNSGTPDNISFDSKNNPVSVNNGFFDRCTPNTETGCLGGGGGTATCPGGVSELSGTGFDVESPAQAYCQSGESTSGGATGWLTTQAPVQAGEVITLEFMIWDAGDASWDSSVLLDNFQWQPAPVTTGTGRPPK